MNPEFFPKDSLCGRIMLFTTSIHVSMPLSTAETSSKSNGVDAQIAGIVWAKWVFFSCGTFSSWQIEWIKVHLVSTTVF
jgi:hypothetical protein